MKMFHAGNQKHHHRKIPATKLDRWQQGSRWRNRGQVGSDDQDVLPVMCSSAQSDEDEVILSCRCIINTEAKVLFISELSEHRFAQLGIWNFGTRKPVTPTVTLSGGWRRVSSVVVTVRARPSRRAWSGRTSDPIMIASDYMIGQAI
eukprot:749481-Hanusia_phi.AAC.13